MSLAFRELSVRFFSFSRCLSTGSVVPKFLDSRVQALLSEMTGLDLDKVFFPRIERLKVPQYQLMSEEQLIKVLKQSSIVNHLKETFHCNCIKNVKY
jgi:hypothetical protein